MRKLNIIRKVIKFSWCAISKIQKWWPTDYLFRLCATLDRCSFLLSFKERKWQAKYGILPTFDND